MGTIISWLDGAGAMAFTLSAIAFVALNGIALIAVYLTRDRVLVNRWTAPFLTANLVLLGTGLGIPLATMAARTAVAAIAPTIRASAQADAELRAAGPADAGSISR